MKIKSYPYLTSILSANCTTCEEPIISKENKRCQDCLLVLLPSGNLGRTFWFPEGYCSCRHWKETEMKQCIDCGVNCYIIVDFNLSMEKPWRHDRCKECLEGSDWYPENTIPVEDEERLK